VASFIVENVSVPPEVEAAIDKRSSMAAVGNLNDFVKYQMAKGMETGAGGAAGTASELAVGFAIAQQLMQQSGMTAAPPTPPVAGGTATGAPIPPAATAAPDLLTPADVAKALNVSEADVLAVITSGELKAKRSARATGDAGGAGRVPGGMSGQGGGEGRVPLSEIAAVEKHACPACGRRPSGTQPGRPWSARSVARSAPTSSTARRAGSRRSTW